MKIDFEQCYNYLEEAEIHLNNAKKELEEYSEYESEYEYNPDDIIPDVVEVSNKVKEQIEFCILYNNEAKENLF